MYIFLQTLDTRVVFVYSVLTANRSLATHPRGWVAVKRSSRRTWCLFLIAYFINQIDEALERIQNETYGICRVTGKLIQIERLKAVPTTTISVDAKKADQK